MEKLVSIIVPIYNVAEYLDKCVQTITGQTYKNIEIILVDDGSTDDCPAMCDAYSVKDERIKVIHKKNGGLSDARNAGIEIAKGEYFAFIDSDDYVAEDFIETLLKACEDNDCKIAQCSSINVSDNNGIGESREYTVKILSGYDMIKRIYEDGTADTIVIWSKLYRRELFNGIRFPFGKLHEDEFTDYKLFDKCSKVAVVDKKLYFYRVNPDSIVRRKYSLKRMSILEALEERKQYFENKGYAELVSLTNAAYVKQLILHLHEIKGNKEWKNIEYELKKKLKENFKSVMRDSLVPNGYKKVILKIRYLYWLRK